ncbi:MAG: NFACT RNA binding domain-containing protein [Candidatus Pacearchaeota archaeon]
MIICPICKRPSLMLDAGGITGKYICKNCNYHGNLIIEIIDDYLKFRYFFTSKGNLILIGKNAENNELLIKKYTNKNEFVFHTKAPGSPFCVIKQDWKKIDKKEINETARICGVFSKEWKKGKKIIEVNYFLGKDIYKYKDMPIGTFGVKKIIGKIKVKSEIYLCKINSIACILPYKKNLIAVIKNDKKGLKKEEAIKKISEKLKKIKITDYILSELPSEKIKIEWK